MRKAQIEDGAFCRIALANRPEIEDAVRNPRCLSQEVRTDISAQNPRFC
jgi:hypothetical protein